MVVMGRYFAMVRDTVRPYLTRSVADLSAQQRAVLADKFAARYTQSEKAALIHCAAIGLAGVIYRLRAPRF